MGCFSVSVVLVWKGLGQGVGASRAALGLVWCGVVRCGTVICGVVVLSVVVYYGGVGCDGVVWGGVG